MVDSDLEKFQNLKSKFVFLDHTCDADDTHYYCCRDNVHNCSNNEGNCHNHGECRGEYRCGKNNCPQGFPSNSENCCYNHIAGKERYLKTNHLTNFLL